MTTPLRRRNGRKAACEACRRRKLACDHSYPTCQRCEKLSMKCVYFERSLADTRVNRITEDVGPPPSPSREPVHAPYALENWRVPQQTTPMIDSPTEYLGPTSFTSVFMEHGDRFELKHAVRGSGSQADRVTDPDLSSPPQPKSAADRQRLQLGAEVLQQIPGEQDCSSLFSRHVNPNDGWIRLAAHHSSERMWNAFRPALTRRSTDDLLTLAARISANSKATLKGEQDPQAWLASFTGRQMRWETFGILYTYWAFGAISSSPESEAVSRYSQEHPSVMGPKQLMAHLKHYASLCIDLCRRLSSVNVLFVYLLYKHNILEGILNGDKSLSCWMQHGELVAVTTSIGLHRELTAASKQPTLQHEMKRRVFAAVFNIDKVISTFTGRPPMLSLACSSTCLPLDLSDEALLSGDLQAAAAELDSHGWNKYGQIYSTTILRSRTMFAQIRHEILEFLQASLDAPPEQLVERAMCVFLAEPI
ncbi:putative transcription factor [Aspergillus fischeri NRRL 181]|uniref:Fungal specific transcription factor, putative n=1 Tax=Neosartorya fischeri (strain ATCC 1020 / DSM 3700 / CBS 544.65 / FGSC A1164 / JCM 1740 / NRRL 181 / WB 181) TaxID=331117 RepID=A1D4Y5_NEOFI|nr:fungal specific transcription factor, putative [Aspergillus fischeri NRRL 181]EAW23478.1 fungal specific transcription factor, putative [Aspergillus fischeri NRRL 181]